MQDRIATGGCGAVYAATHSLLGRRAAVKVLHGHLAASPQMVERFVREARAANIIRHPNIVDIFELGALPDGRPYLVMDLLEGTDLDTLLRMRGRLALDEAFEILEPVAEALEAAHAVGIVHRDLKASNVMVCAAGGRRTIKLLDFGVAKLLEPEPGAEALTSIGRRIGTPIAMAPEQIRSAQVDARTDVYAFGVLLFQMLTGRYPFASADPIELERMHLEAPPPRPSELAPVQPPVDAVVLRCLEKDPERRFPGPRAALDALRAAREARPDAAPPSRGAVMGPAVGVYVEVHVDDIDDEQMELELLDDLSRVLDTAESMLRDAGFLTPLHTSNAVLGVRALADEADAGGRLHAIDTALAVREVLDAREAPDARLRVAVVVHSDSAALRDTGRGGAARGPLLRVGSWAAGAPSEGVCATARAVEGLAPAAPVHVL